MTKTDWSNELRQSLGCGFGSATEFMRAMGYKDMKWFKKNYLEGVPYVTAKRYSVKDFVDVNYGIKIF